MNSIRIGAALLGGALLATAASASVTLSYEAAGRQETSLAVAGKQIATSTVSTAIGGNTNIFTGQVISGTITSGGFNTWAANVYGGAGATG